MIKSMLMPMAVLWIAAVEYTGKGIRTEGVRPKSVTIFIVENYGVIYRLRG